MILLRCRPYFVSPLFGSDFIESLGTVAGSLPCSLSTPRRMIGVFVSVLGIMTLGAVVVISGAFWSRPPGTLIPLPFELEVTICSQQNPPLAVHLLQHIQSPSLVHNFCSHGVPAGFGGSGTPLHVPSGER